MVCYQCKTLMGKTFKRKAVLTSYLLLHLFHLLRKKKNQKINQMYFDDVNNYQTISLCITCHLEA